MKNVIITGADGFVGSYTVKAFLSHGVNVLAMDLPEKPNRLEPSERLTYVSCDYTDRTRILSVTEGKDFDTVIHFAWAGSAGKERINYRLQMDNAVNTVELLKLAKEIGCSRFVCAGSIMELEVEAAVHAQGSRPGMAYQGPA